MIHCRAAVCREKYDECYVTESLQKFLPATKSGRSNVLVLLWALAAAGLVLRIILVLVSKGTDDVVIWRMIAEYANDHGLVKAYHDLHYFNHPPLMGPLAMFLFWLSEAIHVPFAWLIKLPSLIGDGVTAFVIYDIWRRRRGGVVAALGVVCVAWSLTSIVFTGYHGNTDGLYAAFALLSAYALEERRSPILCGLALSAAYNVKLIPLLLVPAFGSYFHKRRDFLRFSIGIAAGLVPFVLLYAAIGNLLLKNILYYSAAPDLWGIPALLIHDPGNLWSSLSQERALMAYQGVGKFVVIAGVVTVSAVNWTGRRWTAYELGAMCIAIFLLLAPGFAVQYLVAIVPLMFAARLRSAMVYSWLAGLFLSITYYRYLVPDQYPFSSHFAGPYPMPAPFYGMLVWAALAQFLIRLLFRRRSG